jgi:hypothetical protein
LLHQDLLAILFKMNPTSLSWPSSPSSEKQVTEMNTTGARPTLREVALDEFIGFCDGEQSSFFKVTYSADD